MKCIGTVHEHMTRGDINTVGRSGAGRSPATRHRSKEHARRGAKLMVDIASGVSEAREMRLNAARSARPPFEPSIGLDSP